MASPWFANGFLGKLKSQVLDLGVSIHLGVWCATPRASQEDFNDLYQFLVVRKAMDGLPRRR
jgi:hypothetical protein